MKNVFCKEIAEFECKDCGKYFCEPCCQYHDNSKCNHISNNTMVDESCLNTDKVANAIPANTSDPESSNNSNEDLQVEMIDLTNIDNW